MALGPGSIAFTGFNSDGNDNLSFVALEGIAAGTTIFFQDNEWNGTSFNSGESAWSWTATGDVPAGTIVAIDNLGTGTASSNLGTVAFVDATNRGIANSDEIVYAFVGSSATTPTAFLAAIANDTFANGGGTLAGTGLTVGTHAIELAGVDGDADIAAFNGSRSDQSSLAAYLSIINNPANWSTQDASGDQSADGTAPDVPFSTTAFTAGGTPPAVTTRISTVQGTGSASTMVGQTVTIEAIVVGDFQNGDGDAKRSLNGFYLQEETADQDANAATSEGLFVFLGNLAGVPDVQVGDRVSVVGRVNEFNGSTQITANSVSVVQADAVTDIDTLAVDLDLPAASVIQRPGTVANSSTVFFPDLEAYEGMLVRFPETLTITEQFDLDRFVEVRLAAGERPVTFTHENEPDVAGSAAHLRDVASRTIVYEDGLSAQNTPIGNLDGFGSPYTTANAPRMGDTVANLTGVIDFAFNTYRVRSVEDGANVFVDTNPRQAAPDDVGGTLKVGSFNVLNFFRTLDDGSLTANGLEPRGANTAAELDRQVDKLVNVLSTLDADVLGLIELENNFLPGASGNAIEFLVESLNAKVGAGTYTWVNPGQQFVGGDAIAVGFIYKPSVVQVSLDTTIQILDDSDLGGLGLGHLITDSTVGGVFNGVNTSRAALAVTFEEVDTGGEFTAVVNHFKSKSGIGTGNDADQLDGQGNWQQQREFAATALAEWIETDPTGSGDNDVLIIGDLNAYFREDTIDILRGAGFENLQEMLSDPYSFVFDGQAGALDYILANSSMETQVTGVTEWHINADEADALDYNLDFGRDPAIFDADIAARVSDHDPLLIGLDLTEEPVFRLQILHGSDFEAGLAAIDDAPRFAAIVDRLEDLETNSITLASGDNYIPSPFFNASSDPALDPFFEESIGRADIRILNTIGIEASVIGNHEFDNGPREVQNLIRPAGAGADGGGAYEGTRFSYLAANLDFSGEPDLNPNASTTPITEATFGTGASGGKRLGKSAIIEENGELIGVVGVTTPVFEDITTPGGVRIIGPRTLDANDGDDSDFVALAGVVQAQIDALTAQGINKVVIVSQLQELENEQHLISFLRDVDIVIGGGSNTLLSDETDVLRTGDVSDGPYAQLFTNAGGDQTVLVNTDGNYKYVGRLVVEFDDEGHIIPASLDPNINGAYATDQAGLERVYQGTGIDPFAEGSKGDTVRDLTTVIDGVISVKDGVQFGRTDVYLEGRRGTVRSEETNLGNLSADANLFVGKQTDPSVLISIKNGGGIRDSIGSIAPDGTELPPAANPDANKEAGEVSQLDIENSLRFNNALSLVTLTPQQLLEALENGVSNPGGIFAQVGGLRFSYDSTLAAGNRVQTVALVDGDGRVMSVLVENGEVVADAPAAVRMVTLSFLIGTPNPSQPGGFNRPDGFRFAEYIAANPAFANRVDLDGDASGADDVASRTGAATFTDNGREQDALAEYLAANFSTTPFEDADTPQTGDTRIQNISVRGDTVLDSAPIVGDADDNIIEGSVGNDTIDARDGDDRVRALAGNDKVLGGTGDDVLEGGAGNDELDGGDGDDFIFGDDGDDIIKGGNGDDRVKGNAGNDVFVVVDHSIDGRDTYDGGAGVDTLDFGDSTRSINLNLGDGATRFGSDTIVNIENLFGGTNDDRLSGNGAANELRGNAGNDKLDGKGGDDRLLGGVGDDELDGGIGDDLLEGGEGRDDLDGGQGNDQLSGGVGDDKLTGGDGNDRLDGGDGNDRLIAGSGDDQLFGGAGDDELEGSAGSDLLVGGVGNDKLTGGSGTDRFALNSVGDGIDTITDFKITGSAQDSIVLATSMFQGFTGDDAFDLIGGGFLRVRDASQGRSEIQVDVDGGGNAFQTIAIVSEKLTLGQLADHTIVVQDPVV